MAKVIEPAKIQALTEMWDKRGVIALEEYFDQSPEIRDKALYEKSCVYQECAKELRGLIEGR